MKKIVPLFVFAAVAIALLAAAPADRAKTYDVTADTIEACSCPLFCSCYFGPSADEHMCQANNVYRFRPGSHYGDVDLSNQTIWISLDLGGEWHHHPGPGMETNWAVLTFDRTTSKPQRTAILKVVNTVFPVKWKHFDTREDSIEWNNDPMHPHAKLASGLAEISLDKSATLRPDKATPVVVKNLQYWFSGANDGFVLGYGTHSFGGDSGTGAPKFSYEKRNGFTIAWTAKGNVGPEKMASR
jgi:uncharacterized protein DUF1326